MSKIRALLATWMRYRDETAEASAEYSEELKASGVHPRAFSLVARLARQDAATRSAFLEAFDAYRQALGLDDQASLFVHRWPDSASGDQARGPGGS